MARVIDGGIDFAFYKCPDNKLEKRKIGFTPLGEGQLSENEVTYGIMIIPSNVTLYKFGAHK